ncbi:substrate-binding domain-containing protein [Oryzobacter terrae]|uniref:substrate-binding domain-containing protein n=1 Tax=Oryzobacter terrae TaxID=1620385 RepID=UPI00366EEAF8
MNTVQRPLRLVGAGAAALALALLPAACGSSDDDSSGTGSGSSEERVGVALITKDSTNPFFVTMQKGAQAEAGKNGVDLTIASGKQDGDETGQIQAIEQAIARGDKGILILSNGPSVENSIKKARDAGLYVIALDTPPSSPDVVDITFATDNREAGRLIGKWTAGQLGGKPATIALLDAFTDKVISVDVQRDQGFLEGMGIDTVDENKNADEAKTGKYSGGDYTIVCNEPGGGAEDGGRTAMETCLSKSDGINVVYTINEPTAVGAQAALKAAGITDALVVSVDGGCAGVQNVKDGIIGATSQQYPLKMATLGMEAIAKIARTGEKPKTTDGLDFFNTGVALVTDKPSDGVESIDTAKGKELCWG